MGKRREQIRMTEDEMWAFIEDQKSLQVATIAKDGVPHLTTLWFAVIDGKLVFETFTKSQKIVNLVRDPRMSVLLEAGTEYAELRGVTMTGRGELFQKPEDVHKRAGAVLARNNPDLKPEQLEAATKMMSSKRTAVVFHPDKIVTWDHRKLGGTY